MGPDGSHPSDIDLRPLALEDVPLVTDWIRDDAAHGHYREDLAAEAGATALKERFERDIWLGVEFARNGTHVRRHLMAGWHQGELVAFSEVTTPPLGQTLNRHGGIQLLSVRQDRRGQGLGHGLLREILAGPLRDQAEIRATCRPASGVMELLLIRNGFRQVATMPDGGRCLVWNRHRDGRATVPTIPALRAL